MSPLPVNSDFLRWNFLNVGKRLAHSIGRNRRKILVVVLRIAIQRKESESLAPKRWSNIAAPSARRVPLV